MTAASGKTGHPHPLRWGLAGLAVVGCFFLVGRTVAAQATAHPAAVPWSSVGRLAAWLAVVLVVAVVAARSVRRAGRRRGRALPAAAPAGRPARPAEVVEVVEPAEVERTADWPPAALVDPGRRAIPACPYGPTCARCTGVGVLTGTALDLPAPPRTEPRPVVEPDELGPRRRRSSKPRRRAA